MGLAFSQIDDAVLLTQEKLVKRGAFTDMQTDLQKHVAVNELWKGRTKQFSGGETWDFQVQFDHNHSAAAVGLYETDGTAMTDNMATGKIEARHVNAHYIYELREPAFQRGGTKIVDLVKTRYTAMMVSFFTVMETFLWGKPATSADTKTPYGVDYWLTKYDSTTGFEGGNPTGFTSGKAGISQGTYSRWANYVDRYAAVTKADLVRKMRKAHRKTDFVSPVQHAKPTMGGNKNGIYMNETTIGLFEEEVEKQNMSLGVDIASMDNRVTFKSTPLTWVPFLDDSTDNPVFLLDWSVFAVGIMGGWQNNLTKPYMVPDKHNVRRVDLDASFNTICTDLRRQAVLNTSG